MLTPNDGSRIVLLPQDHEIMDLTGMDEAQYRWFCRQAILHSKLRPGEPTNFLVIPFLIQLAIGIALTYVATLLAPRPKQPEAAQLNQKNVQGQSLVNGARFTPRSGFDSVQNVVELGSVIPLVYTNRQTLGGITYGGVRVNTNLLWSQLYSIGGGQLLRAVFLVGEADIPVLDPTQFAIGNNLINNYDLAKRQNGRVTIYYSSNGGRLTSGDYLAGADPSNDEGNAERAGGADVFSVRGNNDTWTSNFCFTYTPNNQTTFGVYSHIANNFFYRTNPVFRTKRRAEIRPDGEINCKTDDSQVVFQRKQNYKYPQRTGLLDSGNSYRLHNIGEQLELVIYSSTDGDRVFKSDDSELSCSDVGQAISSLQRGYDESINIGDLYRFGSALAICIDRTPNVFVSDSDNEPLGGGRTITGVFEIVRRGLFHRWNGTSLQSPSSLSATNSSQVFKFAEAVFSTERPGTVVEVGLRSALQVDIRGLCNFRDGRTYQKIDDDACDSFDGDEADEVELENFQSGQYSSSENRYSFFRIGYREAGSNDPFTEFPDLFGIRSTTGVAVYNYLRFDFDDENRWEIRITPVSGWEVRSGVAPGRLHVLDPHFENINTADVGGAVRIQFTGIFNISRSKDTFDLQALNSKELGNGLDDAGAYGDAWAQLAESFCYSEISTTATQPEHQVVYVNCISENPSEPNYDKMAILGMNIRSSREITTLNQFSVYVNKGILSTSNFPEVFFDLLTNDRYGTGQVMSPAQIDTQSFDDATNWAIDRRYFFDGAVSEKINLRSWGAETAQNFLLDLLMRNGKFALQPVANFYGPETFTGLFTSGNILEDSFEMSYVDQQDRIPPRVTVVWREERQTNATNSKGLFPVSREVTVREQETPEDAPVEKIDVADYCTSQQHAIDIAKWQCRTRRLTTHTVSFKTTPSEAALDIGAVFKLGMETITYQQPANGAVAANGEVTSWPPLGDGTYPVLLWDGSSKQLLEVNLTITGGKSKSYASSVFCLKNAASDTQSYKTMALSFDEDGNMEVEGVYFPTNAAGVSDAANGFDNSINWIIEGEI